MNEHKWNYTAWEEFTGPDAEKLISRTAECLHCKYRLASTLEPGSNEPQTSWYGLKGEGYFEEPPCIPGGVAVDLKAADKAFYSFLPVLKQIVDSNGKETDKGRGAIGISLHLFKQTSMATTVNPLRVGRFIRSLRWKVLRVKMLLAIRFNPYK